MMTLVTWIKLSIFLCLPYISLQQSVGRDEIIFHYNNTYKYKVLYTVYVNKNTEYIMEFAGDGDRDGENNTNNPARVTVASDFANKTYPLFITARQQKGVFSWQLPMLVQTPMSLEQFTNISRTLCPHNNLFSEDEDTCDVSTLNTPIVHLTSSSPDPIKVTIKVETVGEFYLKLNSTTNLSSTPSQPKYYFYPFDQSKNKLVDLNAQNLKRKYMCNKELNDSEQSKLRSYFEEMIVYKQAGWMSRPKSVIVMIESDDDICAVVSIQNFSCPVFDNERDILYDGYYLTMTRRGGITLTQDTFPLGFYIVFIVKTSDEACTDITNNGTAVPSVAQYFGWSQKQYVSVASEGRVKHFSFRIIETISYQEYIIAAVAALAFFLSFYVAFVISILCERRKSLHDRLVSNEDGDIVSPAMPHDVGNVNSAVRRRHVNVMDGSGSSHSRHCLVGEGDVREGSSSSDTESDISTVATEDIQPDKDLYRINGKLCVANLARCRPRVLQARSKMYLWNVLTVAVFYTLPVIQLVVTYQRMLNQSGNQDLCYFNFLCAHPLMVLSDFNHVYSNLGYILLGVLFVCRVWHRQKNHPTSQQQQRATGIPQHFGLLYAMGVALISEGLLSAAYHVCPNSMNFQFDTSFMYVTSVLCMVKIYQSRHPDINARAHATFAVLALIIFIGLVGVLNANFVFWIGFTALHLVTCLVMTFQIYYLGRFRMDVTKVYRLSRELVARPLAAITPMHCGRCVLLLIANLSNWCIAAYGVTQHSRDFASHLLLVLMSNLFLYTLFYIVMKLLHRETIRWYSWVYIALTYTTWFGSSYFYLDQSTNWALHMKKECARWAPKMLTPLDKQHRVTWQEFLDVLMMFFLALSLLTKHGSIQLYNPESKQETMQWIEKLTPAQSRQSNRVCSLLQLYDSHDVWHFLSSTAMFFSFNMYLTIDDNLADVPRSDIMVF